MGIFNNVGKLSDESLLILANITTMPVDRKDARFRESVRAEVIFRAWQISERKQRDAGYARAIAVLGGE